MIVALTIWTLFSFAAQDTIPPVAADSLLHEAVTDTLPPEGELPPVTDPEKQEEEQLKPVHIWSFHFPEVMEQAETDSTLRWTRLLNLFDRFYQQKGAITYRMGTVGRMDGVELHGFETQHFSLEMEGLQLNDPLTGAVNWNRLPIHKISDFRENNTGTVYRAQTGLRDHYLTQPRTYLNFDESKFNYRSLDFVFTQNIRQTTNIELSFWDRRDGGGYNRQLVEGRQGVARISHQLSDYWLVKAGYINNALDREEPFGYLREGDDPRLYHFNRFVASSVAPSAKSNQTSSDVYLKLYHRPDVNRKASSEFGVHYQIDRWSLEYSADSVATDFQNMELFARHHLALGSMEISATARGSFRNERIKENLEETRWLGGGAEIDLYQPLFSRLRLYGHAAVSGWNDGRITSHFSGKMVLNITGRTRLSLFGGILSRAPDIQAAYWISNTHTGNAALANERSLTGGAIAEIGLGRVLTLGFRGDARYTENAVFLSEAGQFMNIDPYNFFSGTAWIGLDSSLFEGEVSAVYKTTQSASAGSVNRMLDQSGERVWLKSHIYWKNYVFNRAAYIKAGFSGMISPNAFRPAEYMTALNRWQHGTNDFMNPSYTRLDLDVSARIRWFMLLIKWENILDRVNQLGYFETTGYPMPERRFTLGLRVLFTN